MIEIELLYFVLKCTSVYFVLANGIYLVLLLLSWLDLRDRRKSQIAQEAWIENSRKTGQWPRMTFLIPAYNEEAVILESMRAHLLIAYPNLEFIVVDDGCTDKTAEILIRAFNMRPAMLPRLRRVSGAEVKEIYRSSLDPRLCLIRQENRGKAAALNTALDHATGEFCCTADADTIPEPDSVLQMVYAFSDQTKYVVAVGGTVRIANGAVYRDHKITQGRLPESMLLNFQIIEYIRSFYCGRSAWEWVQATVLLSGAMAAFRTSVLTEVEGFDELSMTEDLEIILRLRWQARLKERDWAICLVPDPLCWTQAPSSIATLRRQRIRWQQGLAQTMWKYFSLILNPSYGSAGSFHLPYILFFEWIGPLIELTAYLAGATALWFGFMDLPTAVTIVSIGLAYSVVVSVLSIHFEEGNFARHPQRQTKIKFLAGAILENFGYRQLTWWFRLEAMIRLLFQKPSWGQQNRHSMTKENDHKAGAA